LGADKSNTIGQPVIDTLPNCFHESSTGNLHFHGSEPGIQAHRQPARFPSRSLAAWRSPPRRRALVTRPKLLLMEEPFGPED
jgi:hypothetical protein